jgi:hypothetical protein
MQLRLTADEERPFAPFALSLAAGIGGLVAYDLVFWARSTDHRPTLAHTPGYGLLLLVMWLWLAWASRSRWLQAAWMLLALNEVLSMVGAAHPDFSPWWRRDVLLVLWSIALCVWGWRQSPAWVRFAAMLLCATGLLLGQVMLSVERHPPVVRSTRSPTPQ